MYTLIVLIFISEKKTLKNVNNEALIQHFSMSGLKSAYTGMFLDSNIALGEGRWNWNLLFKSLLKHSLNPPPAPRTWDKFYLLQTYFIKMILVPNNHQREKSTKCINYAGVCRRWVAHCFALSLG